LAILPHGVRHRLEHICMFAWMNSGHKCIFHKWKLLNSESFIQILSLNILFNIFVVDRLPTEVSGAEKHSGSVVVLVIDYVHCVVAEILLFHLILLLFCRVEYYYLLPILSYYLLLSSILDFAYPFFATHFL
jgi:hypothetical protein